MIALRRRGRGRAGLAAALLLLVLASCGEPGSNSAPPADGDGAGSDGRPAAPMAPTDKATATLVPPEGREAPPVPQPPEPAPDEPAPDEPAPDEVAPDEPAPDEVAPDEPAPEPSPAPPPGLPAGLLGQDIERIPTSSRVIALTFDAGANADAVRPILATLAAEQLPGTFFLTGAFVEQFPSASRSIADSGHRLANHSVSHPHFTSLTGGEIRAEVRGGEQDIQRVTGGDPLPFFRFPFGDRDARTIAAVNDLGYLAVRWTTDTLGWQGTSGGRTAAEVTRRVTYAAQPGQIVLMHVGSHPTDGSTLDADALPDVIENLRSAGYRFVTLDALLR